MKTMTKNFLIATTLAVISTSAFSQVTNRDEERRDRYRERHKNMDICIDIKENLISAEDAYVNFDIKLQKLSDKISNTKSVLRNRKITLQNKKNAFETAKRQVRELTELKAQKPRLMAENQAVLSDTSSKLPGLKMILDQAQEVKNRKCKTMIRFGRRAKECKRAKKALKTAKRNYNTVKQQKDAAVAMINKLNSVEADLRRVSQIKKEAKISLSNEESITPSIAQISTKVNKMIQRRQNLNIQFNEIEDEFGRLEVRLEKCESMKYHARNGKAFKKALVIFAADNGAGCSEAVDLISNARGRAAKDGINEAYELVCKSDVLVRTVEAPVVETDVN